MLSGKELVEAIERKLGAALRDDTKEQCVSGAHRIDMPEGSTLVLGSLDRLLEGIALAEGEVHGKPDG
jgi:hypothetical protein